MRLQDGARRMTALALLLLLTGCSGAQRAQEAAQALREVYAAQEYCSATAEVTADYGARAYQYTAQFAGNETAGEMTVLAPASIAGTGAAWAEGQLWLEYEGISLETGALSPDGLSPADVMPALLAACRSALVAECAWQRAGGGEEDCLYLLLEPVAETGSLTRIAVWADAEDYALRRAELYQENRRVLALVFSEFVWPDRMQP